jgi:ABC-type bacteriocin/lantibiotic exporter with double-glycine peptidase domain
MIIEHKSKRWAKPWRIKKLWLLSLFIFGACTTTPSFLGTKYGETLPYKLIKNVPFYSQNDFHCGPSSLAGVFNYYGKNIPPSQIADRIFKETVRGTLSIDMALYARDQGFVAEWYTGDLTDLRENIDNNFPLIAMIDLGLGPIQKPHFLVIVGYDPKGVIVNSGVHQHKTVPWHRFHNQWSRSSLWTLRIHPGSLS